MLFVRLRNWHPKPTARCFRSFGSSTTWRSSRSGLWPRDSFALRLRLAQSIPGSPMETLERLFIVLRDQAEMELARVAKLQGSEARRAMIEADRLAKLVRMSAQSLRIAAEVRGIWTSEYIDQLGLAPWV